MTLRIPELCATARYPSLAVIAVVLICVGCTAPASRESQAASVTVTPTGPTSTPTPTSSAAFSTPSPTESPAPSPTSSPVTSSSASFDLLPAEQPADFVSTISCSGSIGPSDPVAIVELQAAVEGTGDVVLRDYASANPTTACTFGQNPPVQLIDARHVVIRGNGVNTFAVVDLPEVRFHWFQLPSEPDALGSSFIAVSPGLDQVLWLTTHGVMGPGGQGPIGVGTDKVHITTSTGDQIVASVPNPLGGRCGSEEDSKQGAYTHSGAHLFVLDQPTWSLNSLVVVEGETAVLSVVPTSAGWPRMGAHPAMALWSPTSETLFYRQGGDVWTWTAGSNPEIYLQGVSWLRPTITPDGGHLAYAVARPDGLHDVYLVDLAHGGSPELVGEGRNVPVFVNSTQLWYKSEGEGVCGPGVDQPLIYNLIDASEAPSVIYRVFGVWPATSSNH